MKPVLLHKMANFWTVCILAVVAVAVGQRQSYDGHQVLRFTPISEVN